MFSCMLGDSNVQWNDIQKAREQKEKKKKKDVKIVLEFFGLLSVHLL